MGIPDIAVLVMVHNHTDTQMSVLVSCQSVKAVTLKHLPSHVLKHSKTPSTLSLRPPHRFVTLPKGTPLP